MEERELVICAVANGYIVRPLRHDPYCTSMPSYDHTWVFETKQSLLEGLPKLLQMITPCVTHVDLRTGKAVDESGTPSA